MSPGRDLDKPLIEEDPTASRLERVATRGLKLFLPLLIFVGLGKGILTILVLFALR